VVRFPWLQPNSHAMLNISEKARPVSDDAPRRRLPPEERARRILDEATGFFAEHGLGESTRALAERLGVAQALIYRYFPSKQALLDKVIDYLFAKLWDDSWSGLLADRSVPLEERLVRLYRAYLDRAGPVSIRLFVRASLDGSDLVRRYSGLLTEQILKPILAEMRVEAGLPGFNARPMLPGERELAMILHGSVIFLGIRKHVYKVPLPDDLSDLLRLNIVTILEGARTRLRALHEAHGKGAPVKIARRRG
jgi:AcrR family transcriptional regulator